MSYGVYDEMLPVCKDCPNQALVNAKSLYEGGEICTADDIATTSYIASCKLLGAIPCEDGISKLETECANPNAELALSALVAGIRAQRQK